MHVKKPGMCWGGKIVSVAPIEGADRIQQAEVVCGSGGRWAGVVSKDMFIGQAVNVYLPDAIVPNTPETAFMEKHGWRVRPMKLKKVPSEVLITPGESFVGDDLTEKLGVLKYEKDIPAQIAGDVLGPFPSFIPKTDEPNFQTVPELVEALVGKPYYITVKYDGTSQTVYRKDNHFGVCSRNWELKPTQSTNGEYFAAGWRLAHKYDLINKLPNNIALQWECVGPGIQGNPLKLAEIDCKVFNAYFIDKQEYLSFSALTTLCETLKLSRVELIPGGYGYSWEIPPYLRKLAEGNYPNAGPREGVVIRSQEPTRVDGKFLSFKVLNLDYKGQ